jgi:hypothetical protein
MAGTVALQNVTRVAVADGATDSGTWSATGGGAGLDTSDTELFIQGTSAVSIQVSNKTNFSVNYTHNVTIDLTNEILLGKIVNSTFGNISGGGFRLRYGNDASNYYELTIATSSATYQSFTQGVNKFSWWFVPIQPALTGYTTQQGSPGISTWDFASVVLTNNSASRTNNLAMDAIDYCSDTNGGLVVTGGTVPSPATYDDFPAFDDDTVGNKYGFALRQVGGTACVGTLQIGSSATACIFNSAGESLTWIDAAVPAGFMRCVYDLQNASTDIDIDKLVAKSEGNATTTDTRFDVVIVGTSGDFDASASSWLNGRNFTFTSAATFTNCTLQCLDLTQASANIDGGTILTTSAANVAICDDATFGTTTGIRGVEFIQDGSGHAIELTSTGTVDLQDITWTSYGGTPGTNLVSSSGDSGAAIYNNSGGAVTINVNGGNSPSIRNGVGATTTVQVSVPIQVNGVTEGTRCSIIGDGGAEDGVELLAGYADSTGTVSGSFGGTTPQNVIVRARNSGIIGAVLQDDGGAFTDYTNEAREQVGANDVVLLPASPAVSDAVYFGGIAIFEEVLVKVSTAGSTYVGTWEYWNGAWTSLSVTDDTNSFQTSGWNTIRFTDPGDWSTTSVNAQGPFYYIRFRVTTGGGAGGQAEYLTLNKTTKYLPFNGSGTIASGTGLTTTAVWVEDTNAS